MTNNVSRAVVAAVALLVLASWPAAGQAPRDATEKLIAELANAPGVPGFEGPVRDILKREWQPLLADVHADGMGNLFGTLAGGEGPRVLLMAHLDEVGFLVRSIDDRGFVYVNPVGGYFDQSVLTQRLTISTPRGPVTGYTGFKSGHIVSAEERSRVVPLQDMFIDIGAKSREEAMEKFAVRPGLPVTYAATFEVLNGTTRYLARAIDDRALLALATEAMRQLKTRPHPNTLITAATVQEENGMRGASVVYATAKPDIVVNLEIGVAGDFPLLTSPKLSQEALGKGPSVFVFDGTMIPNNKLVEWTLKTARESGIPVQFESITGFGEDGSVLQRSGQGIPVVNIGLPTRYAHSQLGVMDRADYDNMLKLVVEMLSKLSAAEVKAIREF